MKNNIALKPPMGWNSFDCFGWSVTEEEVKANVDYMYKYLKPYGWEYVVVDFCWYCPGSNDNPNPHQKDGFAPRLNMDSYGRLIPTEDRFPSARDGQGFKPLADYIHGKGLKFGIHIMRGVPKQAVAENTMIKGTDKGAADVADTSSDCPWLNYMYGLDMDKKGAQEYINSLFELYENWDIDYIKIDDLSYPYYKKEIEGYKKAIDNCERSIIFSTSPGETPIAQGEHISRHADLWRISADFWDRWIDIKNQFKRYRDWNIFRTQGGLPDGDMLPLGHIALRGPMGEARYTNLTKDEQCTLMTMWCIGKSPLMYGGNMPDNDVETLELLINEEVLYVNQESINNRELYSEENRIIWYAEDPNCSQKFIALFNISDHESLNISLSFKDIGDKTRYRVRDLWTKKDMGIYENYFTTTVNGHGSSIYRISEV